MTAIEMATLLRKSRLSAGLALTDIEQRTRISPSILRCIDQGTFERLPAGIYARAYVRAYAAAVGLDPHEVLRVLEPVLPPAVELVPESPATPRVRVGHTVLMAIATGVDAALLALLYGAVLVVTGWVSGLAVTEVVRGAWAAVLVMGALVTALYFVVFAGIEGRTPGARLLGLPARAVEGPVGLADVAGRAAAVFLSQASLGIDLLMRRSRVGER